MRGQGILSAALRRRWVAPADLLILASACFACGFVAALLTLRQPAAPDDDTEVQALRERVQDLETERSSILLQTEAAASRAQRLGAPIKVRTTRVLTDETKDTP